VVNNLGNVLMACERAEEAVDSDRRAVALEPGFADRWLNLAIALERQDRYQQAADCLMEVDRLRPGDPLIALIFQVLANDRRCKSPARSNVPI
jgi:tetratricopeptide (TPR) repeat protein